MMLDIKLDQVFEMMLWQCSRNLVNDRSMIESQLYQRPMRTGFYCTMTLSRKNEKGVKTVPVVINSQKTNLV